MLLSGIVVGGRILYTLYIFQQPGVAKEKNVF